MTNSKSPNSLLAVVAVVLAAISSCGEPLTPRARAVNFEGNDERFGLSSQDFGLKVAAGYRQSRLGQGLEVARILQHH